LLIGNRLLIVKVFYPSRLAQSAMRDQTK